MGHCVRTRSRHARSLAVSGWRSATDRSQQIAVRLPPPGSAAWQLRESALSTLAGQPQTRLLRDSRIQRYPQPGRARSVSLAVGAL